MDVCEVCQGEPEGECSGLDVPRLTFCLKHLFEHEKACEDVKQGNAQITHWSSHGLNLDNT